MDIPAPLAWPYTERDGSRGKFVLANTGLGVNTWRATALESFARVVRGLKLGPDVEVADRRSCSRTCWPRWNTTGR